MLRENPQSRPNIYQVVREVARIRGTDIPIKDVSIMLSLLSQIFDKSRSTLGVPNQNPEEISIYRLQNQI